MYNNFNSIFHGLDNELKETIFNLSEVKVGVEGVSICNRLCEPEGLYFILNGVVSITISTNNISSEVGLIISKGDTIGAEYIFSENRLFMAMSEIEPATFLYLPKRAVISILSEFPSFYEFLFANVSSLLQRTSQKLLISIHEKDIRIAYTLIDIYYNLVRSNLYSEKIRISQSLLASITCISRPKLNFSLKKLESEKIISLKRGAIMIRDLDKLHILLKDCNMMFFNPKSLSLD